MNSDEIKGEIKKKYDDEVANYDTIFKSKAGKHFIIRKLRKAISFNYIKKNQKVLEIGSATGVFSFEFEKLEINLFSIDLAPKNIIWATEKANEINSSITFKVADVEKLPFEDRCFDGVISFSTLRYIPNIIKALNEIYRVIKPGGYIILDFPNQKCPWFGGLKKKVLGREHIFDHHYNEKQIEKLIIQAGFKNVKIKRGLFIPKSTPDKLFWFFRLFEIVAERLPLLKNYSAIIFVGGIKC